MIILDIETRPRPDLVERFIKPLGEFDINTVKYGNTKDLAKRAALAESKAAEHDTACSDHMAKARDRAALDPLTAEIVVIGVIDEEGVRYLEGEEKDVLDQFWSIWREGQDTKEKVVSWSGNTTSDCFDPNMIIRRSWACGISVPELAINGRYLGQRWEDASTRYLVGKFGAYCALTRAADQLGLFEGAGGFEIAPKEDCDLVTGKDFHLWYDGKAGANVGVPLQRVYALDYLRNDLLLLQAIVDRIY